METNEKNLAKMRRLLSLMDEESLVKEDFVKAFQQVIEFIKKIEVRNLVEFEQIKQTIKTLAEKLKTDNSSDFTSLKTQLTSLYNRFVSDINDKQIRQTKEIEKIGSRVKEIIDDKDYERERTIQETLDKIPEQVELILDDPEKIRDKLELLKGKDRLTIDAIEGLKEALDKVRPKVGLFGGFNYGTLNVHIIDDETPVGTINSSNKSFTINNIPSPATSLKVFLGGARQRVTEDYTLNSKTITFNVAPPTGSILLADYRN